MWDLRLVALFVFGLLAAGALGDAREWLGDRVDLVTLAYVAATALVTVVVLLIRTRGKRR